MKIAFFFGSLLLWAGCLSKTDRLYIHLRSTKWFTTSDKPGPAGGFASVQVILSGSTNGDKLTVRTYGDGLIADRPIKLDSIKNFYDTVRVSFGRFSTAPPAKPFQSRTVLKAYRGSQSATYTIYSGKLQYK